MSSNSTESVRRTARRRETDLQKSIHRWLWTVAFLLAVTDVVFTVFAAQSGVLGATVPADLIPFLPALTVGVLKLLLLGALSVLIGLVHWLFVRGAYSHVAPVFLLFLWLSSALATLGVALIAY